MTTIALSLDALKLCVTAAIESDAMLIFFEHRPNHSRRNPQRERHRPLHDGIGDQEPPMPRIYVASGAGRFW